MEPSKPVQDAAELLREMQLQESKPGDVQFQDIIDGGGKNQNYSGYNPVAGEEYDEDEDFEFANEGKKYSNGDHIFAGENKEDNEFDRIVGALQEVLLDENFERLQKTFCN